MRWGTPVSSQKHQSFPLGGGGGCGPGPFFHRYFQDKYDAPPSLRLHTCAQNLYSTCVILSFSNTLNVLSLDSTDNLFWTKQPIPTLYLAKFPFLYAASFLYYYRYSVFFAIQLFFSSPKNFVQSICSSLAINIISLPLFWPCFFKILGCSLWIIHSIVISYNPCHVLCSSLCLIRFFVSVVLISCLGFSPRPPLLASQQRTLFPCFLLPTSIPSPSACFCTTHSC